MPSSPSCSDCAATPAAVSLDRRILCDRCADRHLAAITGWPELPAAPSPETLVGPDGRRHRMVYRLLRMPGAVTATAEEQMAPPDGGYQVTLSIDHRDDPSGLADRLLATTRALIAHPYLEADEHGRWDLRAHEAWGRLEEEEGDPSAPPRVVIDGHSLTWDEFGHLLSSHVGWDLHVRLGEDPPVSANEPPETVTVAETASDDDELAGAAAPAPRWYILDSTHYPKPAEWPREGR